MSPFFRTSVFDARGADLVVSKRSPPNLVKGSSVLDGIVSQTTRAEDAALEEFHLHTTSSKQNRKRGTRDATAGD